MNLPDKLQLKVLAVGKPVLRAMVIIRILTLHKNHFSVIAGPTDRDGRCSITREEMLIQCNASRNNSIMDYTHPENDGAGRIEVHAMSLKELLGAQKAYELYKGTYPYPKSYDKILKEAYQSISQVVPNELKVEATPMGGDMIVSSITVTP